MSQMLPGNRVQKFLSCDWLLFKDGDEEDDDSRAAYITSARLGLGTIIILYYVCLKIYP